MSMPIDGERRTPRLVDGETRPLPPDTVPPFLSGQNPGDRPWRLRDADGVIRGPYAVPELRAQHEAGRLSGDVEIASLTEENWTKVSDHELWPEITRKKPRWTIRQPAGNTPPSLPEPPPLPTPTPVRLDPPSPEPAPTPRSVPPISTLPPRYVAAVAGGVALSEAREIQEAWAKIRYQRWAQFFILLREVFTFGFFITLGDVLLDWVPGNDTGDLMMGMCLLAVCVGYYTWRAFSRPL